MHMLRSVDDNRAKSYLTFGYCMPTSLLISYVKTVFNYGSGEVDWSGHHLHRILTCILPAIGNRTFGNWTQLHLICGLSSIECGNWTKSNSKLCVSVISEPIKLNRTELNSIHWIVFDWARQPNSIEHNPVDCFQLCSVSKFTWTKIMLCESKTWKTCVTLK